MPAAAISISDTITPISASAPPSLSPARTVGIDAGITTRVICCGKLAPMLRAATRKVLVDRLNPRGRRKHHREEAIDACEGDLGLRPNAQPGREDRIKDDDGNGVEA